MHHAKSCANPAELYDLPGIRHGLAGQTRPARSKSTDMAGKQLGYNISQIPSQSLRYDNLAKRYTTSAVLQTCTKGYTTYPSYSGYRNQTAR